MTTKKIAALVTGALALFAQSALAAVSADEAKQLGTTLTEFGAEKAANKDGSIPAYTGGLDKVAGYDPKTSKSYVDPFAAEKPLYTIDAKNATQYDALLTVGTKAMIKQYPGYRVDVYPSHRTMRYPDWVLKNTVKNATTAKLGGAVEGDNLMGADAGGLPYAGVPFPIPKTGYEVLWNYFAHYAPAVNHRIASGWMVDTAGNTTALPTVDEWFVHPWYDKAGKLKGQTPEGTLYGFNALLTSPPQSAGIVFLNFYTAKGEDGGQKVWFYTPGQRRVRMAPEFAYDVPIASYGGVIFWDETFGLSGRLDRFDYKLVGKKEMIVPYNLLKLTNVAKSSTYFDKKFLNPENVRWEKHRVWVVEATRKASARHIYSKRTYYVDEDSWLIVANEGYDNAGNIYRVSFVNSFPTYDVGGMDNYSWVTYDLIKGNYAAFNFALGDPQNSTRDYDSSEGLQLNLTAQSVAAAGVR